MRKMSRVLKVGKWNNNYKYFLFAIIFDLISDISFGSANVDYFEVLKIFEISDSFIIHKIFCYLLTIILSIILYNYEYKFYGDINEDNSSQKLVIPLEQNNKNLIIELIHNEEELKSYSIYKLLIIVFIWIVEEELISYYGDIMMHLDFWMLELIIISFFMVKILNIELYAHQKLMLILSFIPFILKVLTIYFAFEQENYSSNEEDKNKPYKFSRDVNKLKLIYVAINWLIGVALVIYLILITMRAYINTKIKYLMDLKYISPLKILIFYGIIGFSLCLIICTISTFIDCGNDVDYSIQDYFCKVKYNNKRYLDNFVAYFTYSGPLLYEILSVIVGVFSFFLYKYFSLRTIEHLTPVHIIFSFPIYYILNKAYLLIINFIKTGSPYIKQMKYGEVILYLDFGSDFISIIGYLFYLEIIEIHCFGIDRNIRRNILERGDKEADKSNLNKSYKTDSELGTDKQNESSFSGHSSIEKDLQSEGYN